ncbi:aldehyde dehydrogenase [Gordonia rubripertincta]|uniref:aldehyde dehydrogenase family protein n=1 Tax=Gordonia rubripertincta TaxID=36822 RepID=UPI00117E04BE|nr:aldehyde dehydrogenase family protein [Gordonia rubripertincta]TSD95865.1 aldehyde dehydrogenase [Gordonia rubripertincta]
MTAGLSPPAHAELDGMLAELAQGAIEWAAMPLEQRSDLFLRTRTTVGQVSRRWAEISIRIKSTPPSVRGEEWLAGPYIIMAGLTTLAKTMRTVAAGRSTVDGVRTGSAPGGRLTLKVMPLGLQEALLFNGLQGEIWMPPGIGYDAVRAGVGLGTLTPGDDGGVGLVLGAGNATLIGPYDVLYELVAYNRVSILKLNPTFGDLHGIYLEAFAPLIEANVMRVVNGDIETGEYLTSHPGISHVHITGSRVAHDAIVWGVGGEGERRRSEGTPLLNKPITSELGGVSPIIVVPGKWSSADIRYQAENVVTQRIHNAGHNCVAGQSLILSSSWPQRAQFLDAIRSLLDKVPPRAPWYPGSDRKMSLAEQEYPHAEHHGGRLLIQVDNSTSDALYNTEFFSLVLGHTALPGTGAAFLRDAVHFANTRLAGQLGACVIVSPRERKTLGPRLNESLADLRYGAIGVNCWTAFVFLSPTLTWGAYPGNTLDDVGSGIGVVHNGLLIPNPEKSVVYGSFRPFPRSWLGGESTIAPPSPVFVTSKANNSASKALTHYAARPGWARIPQVFRSILFP